MASGVTRLSDLIVPQVFDPYVSVLTTVKSKLLNSGAVARSADMDAKLNSGGLTFTAPHFKDLDNDAENVSNDDPTILSTPMKIATASEIFVRLSRNQSWSSMDLAADLAGVDPMQAIANRVADYWVRRYQAAFIAMMKGIFDNNAATTDAYHTQNDMLVNISGSAFDDGVTNFSASAFIDAALTMGDSMDDLALVMVHSVVYARMLKNNLIDFVQDSGNAAASPSISGPGGIATFMGRRIIVDDSLPVASGVFQSWFFGNGAVLWGEGTPKHPTEVDRVPNAGNGSGQDVLHSRKEFAMHPRGHAYIGTPAAGGPTNADTTNNLADDASWRRVYTERKQIKIARLTTREF